MRPDSPAGDRRWLLERQHFASDLGTHRNSLTSQINRVRRIRKQPLLQAAILD
jgi:hypothetical protein